MLLAILLIVPACGRNEPRSTQAAPEQRANTDQMKNERDAYVKSVDDRLSAFDKKVDQLDKKGSDLSGDAKTKFDKSIDALRDQRKSIGPKLDDLKKVNVESWTGLKGGVDSALTDLDRSYTQVADAYEKNPATTNPKAKTY
jgi:hypothetical protein